MKYSPRVSTLPEHEELGGLRPRRPNSTNGNLPPRLSRREYFAALAMQNLVHRIGTVHSLQTVDDMAVIAVGAADALIARLDKEQE